MYFAPGATHAPHHVPQEWADKYEGQFADGWDRQRELTFARQKEMGVIGPDAKLTARHGEIPAWDDMPEELRPVLEREMEVYAGFLEHTDHHVGRVIDAIEQLGILDNTLIYYIIGDNGASAEGTINGAFNEMANFNGMAALETPEFMLSKMDELGTPTSYNHYAVGWAWAMDTPYQWTKQVASHWGGTRNGTIVHWPDGITEQGGLRSQFCHVIDVAPTILEAAGHPRAALGQRRAAVADRGHAHALQLQRGRGRRAARPPVLRDVRQPRHLPQGVERGHQAPHPVGAGRGQAGRLRRRRVGALRREQGLDPGRRPVGRAAREVARAAASVADRGRQVQRAADRRPRRRAVQPRHRRAAAAHHRDITAVLPWDEAPVGEQRHQHQEQVVLRHRRSSRSGTKPAQGVIIAQGGAFGGWALYAKEGRAKFVYNVWASSSSPPRRPEPIPAGEHQVRMEFAYDGGGLAKGGTSPSTTTAKPSERAGWRPPSPWCSPPTRRPTSATTTGCRCLPTTSGASKFNGKIDFVQIDIGDDNHDHLVDPADLIKVAISRQ